MFCCCFKNTSVISLSAKFSQHPPVFAKFEWLIELWLQMHDLELFFFDHLRDVAVTTNFVGKVPNPPPFQPCSSLDIR